MKKIIIFISVILCSCSGCVAVDSRISLSPSYEEIWDGTPIPDIDIPPYDPEWDQGVTLTEGTTQWLLYAYHLDRQNAVLASSFDGETIVKKTFKTYVLENETLKVTLVPEFGGRILSILYKPTGHEELWQNPVGAPYGIGEDIFYYDWLLIYGGIFPTYPEPEHGKTWLFPWAVEIIQNDSHAVEIQMSFTDTIQNPNAPGNYSPDATGIICRYSVRLEDGRTALDTHVELENPNDHSVMFEYWTNTGLAPGSEPGFAMANEQTEMIIPVEKVRIPPWYLSLAEEEAAATEDRVFLLNDLRWFKNWQQEGILYAYPDMGYANFWGVINHSNEEGIFRIADHSKTPGLKIWTFGYDSVSVDPFAGASASRPFIELWAGVTPEFFQKKQLGVGEIYAFDETFSPSVGLTSVSQASDSMLVQSGWNDTGQLYLNLFSMQQERTMRILIQQNGSVLLDTTFDANPLDGNHFLLADVTDDEISITIHDDLEMELFTGIINPD